CTKRMRSQGDCRLKRGFHLAALHDKELRPRGIAFAQTGCSRGSRLHIVFLDGLARVSVGALRVLRAVEVLLLPAFLRLRGCSRDCRWQVARSDDRSPERAVRFRGLDAATSQLRRPYPPCSKRRRGFAWN